MGSISSLPKTGQQQTQNKYLGSHFLLTEAAFKYYSFLIILAEKNPSKLAFFLRLQKKLTTKVEIQRTGKNQ